MSDVPVTILRCDGSTQETTVPRQDLRHFLCLFLQCEAFDFVHLRDGRTMWVDDTGLLDGKPVNPQATVMYHRVCGPGTTHPIAGDVALVPTDTRVRVRRSPR